MFKRTSFFVPFLICLVSLFLFPPATCYYPSHYQRSFKSDYFQQLQSKISGINFQESPTLLSMHFFHDHSHSHSHSHSHDHHDQPCDHSHTTTSPDPLFSLKTLTDKNFWKKPKGAVLLIATSLLMITSITRKKLTKLDILLFTAFTFILSIFDSIKGIYKSWTLRLALFQEGIRKHSTPLTSNYLFNNTNVADRITLLGVVINIILSISKFVGGIVFNSAVLVADAGHSLSDLFSDFITLWAVQIARLPADRDHPYGHGKFESIGSLFLSLTLLATGLSVGAWSYSKMVNVLTIPKKSTIAAAVASSVRQLHSVAGGHHHHAHVAEVVKLPAWPALALAAISIVSKEWLYRITKKVGERLNSQILIANAWYDIAYLLSRHHRSDSFSSVLSLFSIAAAIYLPGFLFVDSAAGILIAGMICLTGFEILMESIHQLTDSLDEKVIPSIAKGALTVEGVNNVLNIRARRVGSGSLVDLVVLIDPKLSSSAAHTIAEKTRWKIMQSVPNILDVLVKTQATETVVCPLLTQHSRSIKEIEESVRKSIESYTGDQVGSLHRVTVHYSDTSHASVEVVLNLKDNITSLDNIKEFSKNIKQFILNEQKDINHVEIQLNLSHDS